MIKVVARGAVRVRAGTSARGYSTSLLDARHHAFYEVTKAKRTAARSSYSVYLSSFSLPSAHTAPGNRVARGGTQGGLNCLTHVLPRCLPTPTEEADGNGYGVIAGRGGPSRPPPRASVNLVPLLLTGVRLHPPGRTRFAGFSLIT